MTVANKQIVLAGNRAVIRKGANINIYFESYERALEIGGGEIPYFCRAKGNGENMDIRPMEMVDIVWNVEEFPFPIEDGTYDLIYCSYVIEHVNWRKVKQLFKEMFRILKPGGDILITTANLLAQCKLVANSTKWDEPLSTNGFSNMIFGGQDYGDNSHKCGFCPASIKADLEDAGFKVGVFDHPFSDTDMVVYALKPETEMEVKSWEEDLMHSNGEFSPVQGS